MGARPGHRPWRGRCWNPAEPGNPTGTFLEVSYDRAPSDLHQVQPVSLTQRTAGGLRTQEYTAYTHSGKGGSCRSMLFTQMGLFAAVPQTTSTLMHLFLSGLSSTLRLFLSELTVQKCVNSSLKLSGSSKTIMYMALYLLYKLDFVEKILSCKELFNLNKQQSTLCSTTSTHSVSAALC